MVKLEDQTILKPEDINTACCPICGESIKWGGNERSYVALHCDRTMSLEPQLYRATVRKLTSENINSAIEANTIVELSETVIEETEDKDPEFSDEEVEESLIDDEDEVVDKPSGAFSGFTHRISRFNS